MTKNKANSTLMENEIVSPTFLFNELRDHIDVYVNYTCNLRCTHCFVGEDLNLADSFSLSDLILLLQVSFEGGAKSVSLLGGEPTIHPQLLEIVKASFEIGYDTVKIVTNGMKPSQNFMLSFAQEDYKPKIIFSIDGNSTETHESIRGKGTFGILKQSIDIAIKNGFVCGAITTISTDNILETIPLIRDLNSFNFEYLNIHYMNPIGVADSDKCVSPNNWRSLHEEIKNECSATNLLINFERKFISKSDFILSEKPNCVVTSGSGGNIMVFPDGRVYMCALFFDSNQRNSFFWENGNFIVNNSIKSELSICNNNKCSSCPGSLKIANGIPNVEDYHISCMYHKLQL